MSGQSPNQLLPDPLPFEEIKELPFPSEWNDALLATNCQPLRIAVQATLNAIPPQKGNVTLAEVSHQLNTAQGPDAPYTFIAKPYGNPLANFLDGAALLSGMVDKDSVCRYGATDKGRAATPILGILAAHHIEYNIDLSREIGHVGRQQAVMTPATNLALIQEIANSGPIDPVRLSAKVGIPDIVLNNKITYFCTQDILKRRSSSGP